MGTQPRSDLDRTGSGLLSRPMGNRRNSAVTLLARLLLTLALGASAIATGGCKGSSGGEDDANSGGEDGSRSDAGEDTIDAGAADAHEETDGSIATDASSQDARVCGPACDDVLGCWDEDTAAERQSTVEVEVHRSRLSIFKSSSELDDDGSPWASNVIDGDPETVWRSNPRSGSDEAIILRLDTARRVRAVDVELGAEGPYAFNLFVSPDGSCFGAPVATGTLEGVELQTIRIEGTGRVGRFIKLSLTPTAAGVVVSEVRVHATAGLWHDTYPIAVEERGYEQRLEADIPNGPGRPVAYAILRGPSGASITADGLLQWTPDDALPAGPVTFEVSATSDDVTVTKTFDVRLFERTVISVTEVNQTIGATIAVSGTGTSVDGLTFKIPPGGGEHVEIWSLSSALGTTEADAIGDEGDPASAEAFKPWGSAFIVVGATKPFSVEASEQLLATIRGGTPEAPSLILAAYDLPAEDKPRSRKPRLDVVGGAECEGTGDTGTERQNILSLFMEPNILAQLIAHDGKCYRREALPFVFYYWDNKSLSTSAIDARANEVLLAATRTKSRMQRSGCAPLNDRLEILMVPLKGAGGIAPRRGRQVLIDREALPGANLRSTVHHELTHTIHQRTVRWVNEAGYEYDRSPDNRWSIEGLAVFNEDEVEDLDEWSLSYLFDASPDLDRDTVTQGLRGDIATNSSHPYLQFTFLKALKARKHFDICQYLGQHVGTPNAYDAVDAVVGGTEQRHLEYAQFAATWLLSELSSEAGRIDDDLFLPNSVPDMKNNTMVPEFNLPGCGNPTTALELPLGTIAGAAGVRFTCKSPPEQMLDYRVSLVTPEDHAALLVFDALGKPIGEPVRAPNDLTLPSGQTQFEVVVALDQGPIEAGLGIPKPVRLRIDTRNPAVAFEPTTATEAPTDTNHPAVVEFEKSGPKAQYFDAAHAPAGWPETAFYEPDHPGGVRVGNLDWRGARGDVVTWDGPHGRSSPTLIYDAPVNMPPGYVTMVDGASRRVHRGTAVYARGQVLYDFAEHGYVAGAAIRYVTDPATRTEKRYLLAATVQRNSEVDRLWSVELDVPAPVLVDAGSITPPAGIRLNRERANGYFCNDMATRCSSVIPIFSSHDITQDGETTSRSLESTVVCHVDWLTPIAALVSFEPEVVGTSVMAGSSVFRRENGNMYLDNVARSSETVPDVTLAIDYLGNRELRMFARSTQSYAYDLHESYTSGSDGNHSTTEESHTTYSIGSLTLEDVRTQRSFAEAGYTSLGLPVSVDVSSESVDHQFAYVDLRYGDVIYVKTRGSGTTRGSGDYCATGTREYSVQMELRDRAQVLGTAGGTDSEAGDLSCPDGGWWEINRYFDSGRPGFSENHSSTGVASVGMPASPQLQLVSGTFQVLPEIARVSRTQRVMSIELPDFSSATFSGVLRFGRASDIEALVQIDGISAPGSFLGLSGTKLKLRRLGVF